MKALSMDMGYLMLSYPSREEQEQDLARGGGSCGDSSNDKTRVCLKNRATSEKAGHFRKMADFLFKRLKLDNLKKSWAFS